jgi:hypothetical protein
VDVDWRQPLVAYTNSDILELDIAGVSLVVLIETFLILSFAVLLDQFFDDLDVFDVGLAGELDEFLVGVFKLEGHEEVVEIVPIGYFGLIFEFIGLCVRSLYQDGLVQRLYHIFLGVTFVAKIE